VTGEAGSRPPRAAWPASGSSRQAADPPVTCRARLGGSGIGSARTAPGELEHLRESNLEHECGTAVRMAEHPAFDGEVPVAVVLPAPGVGESPQPRVIRHVHGVAFDDVVEPLLPPLASGGERHVWVSSQIDRLLFARTGTEVEPAFVPDRRQRCDMRPAIAAHGGDPEEFRRPRGRRGHPWSSPGAKPAGHRPGRSMTPSRARPVRRAAGRCCAAGVFSPVTRRRLAVTCSRAVSPIPMTTKARGHRPRGLSAVSEGRHGTYAHGSRRDTTRAQRRPSHASRASSVRAGGP
jgi:hypothetical protein